MHKHGNKRVEPASLIPGTVRIISVRMDYLPDNSQSMETLENKDRAYISRYALGRDYHKVLKKKLNTMAKHIEELIGPFGYRAFVDSAPVMERAIAEKSGLGWVGKNTCIINKKAGSWFFLGELYTDLPLEPDEPVSAHCGDCTACLDICPTKAIVAPYQIDSRRCISYLTIENTGPIPIEFRKKIGNRIYGCDDCQLFCPWNRFAKPTQETDFQPRHQLSTIELIECFLWSEQTFKEKTQGSAMKRCGYDSWLRNLAVALGNANTSDALIEALKSRREEASPMVQEHIDWALLQHQKT
jgi:epoxyqueuosine reductase